MWGRVPRRRLAGGTPVDYANDIRVIDGRGGNYSKVWIRGAYLRDITRQIAISRADLHRTCRDVASPNEMCIIYVRTSVCARASVFEESRNGSWRRDVSNYDTASVPEYRVE